MMFDSRSIRVSLICAPLIVTVMVAGCGGTKAVEEPPGNAADPAHTSDAADADDRGGEAGSVELSPEAMQRAEIRIDTVQTVSRGQVLLAPAELQPNGDRIARVGPRVAGRIARVLVSIGASVRAGQPLATIHSPEVAEATAALDSARAGATLARTTLAREQELLEKRVSARREVLEAEAAVANAEASVRSAEARLAAKGFIGTSMSSQGTDPVVTVTSPISGTVIDRAAAADAPVGPDSVLFTIADLSSLWLTVRVPETSVAAIRRGQAISVVLGGMPDHPVEGRVDYIAPTVAPETRTVEVRLQVPNRGGELRPGTSASARFDLPSRSPASIDDAPVLVPHTAVQEFNQGSVVFVPTGERQFRAQPVTLGSSYGNEVEVLSGIKTGDRIVVQGAFTLKAQALRGAVADPH